jgi:RanBP1 domain
MACAPSSCRSVLRCSYDQGSGEWKERGVGPMKLLRHKDNDRIRLLMRQDKTLKIRANHIGQRRHQQAASCTAFA